MGLIPEKIRRLNRSNEPLVPVIAAYNRMGQIRPVLVRINGEAYRILSYERKTSSGLPIEVFRCVIPGYERKQEITLTFHRPETCWTLKL